MERLLAWLRDDDLSAKVLENDADRPWWGLPALAASSAVLFYALVRLYRIGPLISFMPGDFNRTASVDQLTVFLAAMWVFVVVGWFVPAAYRRVYLLGASAATAPILVPLQSLVVMPLVALGIYLLVNAKLSKTVIWVTLILFWTLFFLSWRGQIKMLVVPRQMQVFAVIAFFAMFLKSVYYLFEKTTLLAGKPEPRPLRNFLLYLFAGPFFLVPYHIKPIGYAYLHGQFLARPRTKILRDGVILFGQGILYLVIRTFVFSHWLDWQGSMAIQDVAAQLPWWQILAFSHYNFLRIFLELAGNVYLIIGLWRMFGWDLKADFYYPFFAKNLLEHWRRWNIYNRDFVVAFIFNPVLIKTGRKIGKYWAYMLACILCFFVGLGVMVHLIPISFYRGNMEFAYPILVRSGLLGVLTGINIWLDLWIAQKGRKRRLRGWVERYKIVPKLVHVTKIYFTFYLMSCIYMIQQGLTSGLTLTEVLKLLSRVFTNF